MIPSVCREGHPLDEQNLYVRSDGRSWHCRTCHRDSERVRHRLKMAHRYLEGWAAAIDGAVAHVPLHGTDQVAVIDVADVELVSHYRWRIVSGYAQARPKVDGKVTSLLMHRLLLNPEDGLQVDHIDRDRLNNRRANLRLATPSQNMGNCGRQVNNTSGYKGVHQQSSGRWSAKLNRKWLGTFDTAHEAAAAYDAAALEHFGEFAATNGPRR